jgi:hypothetical protein
MKYFNKLWFSLVEIIISWLLLVIFLFWSYNYYNIQNKNYNDISKEFIASNLLEEAMTYISRKDYDSIVDWDYGLYFQDSDIKNWEYTLNPINYNNSSYEDWKYINWIWYKIDYDPNKLTWVYKRIIRVYPEDEVFLWSKFKRISIYIWYEWCNFSWDACIKKDFIILDNIKYD